MPPLPALARKTPTASPACEMSALDTNPEMTDPVQPLLDLLDLDDLGSDRFKGANPDHGFSSRVFGGQVAAQALQAAVRTLDVDHHVHSLHAYFLRPGAPGIPITFAVERTRDGRSFSTRRVLASQRDDVIFEMSSSFHTAEPGADYQLGIANDAPDPDGVPDGLAFLPDAARARFPMDIRELGPTEPDGDGFFRSTRRVWMRIRRRIPDDPLLHACGLAYLSDMGTVFAAITPIATDPSEQHMAASLDHALWFHRPIRADEWFLYDLHAVSVSGARGLTRGTIHSADGTLGISVAQEALVRVVDPNRS